MYKSFALFLLIAAYSVSVDGEDTVSTASTKATVKVQTTATTKATEKSDTTASTKASDASTKASDATTKASDATTKKVTVPTTAPGSTKPATTATSNSVMVLASPFLLALVAVLLGLANMQ